MKVVVLIKPPHRNPHTTEVLPGLSPCDRAALEWALLLARSSQPSSALEVVAVTLGPASDEPGLKKALSAGAQRAVRIWDACLAVDNLRFTAEVLASTVQKIGFDLILAGNQSADWGRGAMGPILAQLLDLPHLTSVIALHQDAPQLVVEQLREREIIKLQAALPLLLAVAAGPHERRPATADANKDATIEQWSLKDLGLVLDTEMTDYQSPHHLTPYHGPAQRLELDQLLPLLRTSED